MRGGGYLSSPKDEILSITNTDKLNGTSFVKVGELFDEDTLTFDEDNYKILLKYVTGNSSATLATATALAETNGNKFADWGYEGTDASVFRATAVSAGTEGDTAYVEKAEDKDICVRLGGLDWEVMYLSKDKNNNTILTLWLDNSVQEAWDGRSATEGAYYGFIDGSLYSAFTTGWDVDNVDDEFPASMYGSSYVRAVTLNNGGVYATSGSTYLTAAKSKNNVFSLFTMPQFGLTDYIVTPRDVSWQENQNEVQLSATAYGYMNGSWQKNASWYQNNEMTTKYASKTYYDAWADDYIWLPSIHEVIETNITETRVYDNLWNSSNEQQVFLNGEDYAKITNVTLGSSGSITEIVKNARERSSCYNAYGCNKNSSVNASGGSGWAFATNVAGAIRPALHINLSKIDQSFDAVDISSGEISVEPETDTYNGSVKNPTVSVTLGDVTLVNGTDYLVRACLNGVQVDEIKSAGVYTLVAVGKVNYTGSLSTTFTMIGGALNSTIISPPNECVVFKRSDGGPKVYLNDTSAGGNYRLIQGTDYTITHTIDYTALTGTARIVGLGNYLNGVTFREYTLVLLDPKAGMYMAIYN